MLEGLPLPLNHLPVSTLKYCYTINECDTSHYHILYVKQDVLFSLPFYSPPPPPFSPPLSLTPSSPLSLSLSLSHPLLLTLSVAVPAPNNQPKKVARKKNIPTIGSVLTPENSSDMPPSIPLPNGIKEVGSGIPTVTKEVRT